jgi:hypothetical protein
VAAASVLLSYGWGKPKQVIEANAETSITLLHLTAARTIAAGLDHSIAPLPTIEGTLQPQGGDLTEPALE